MTDCGRLSAAFQLFPVGAKLKPAVGTAYESISPAVDVVVANVGFVARTARVGEIIHAAYALRGIIYHAVNGAGMVGAGGIYNVARLREGLRNALRCVYSHLLTLHSAVLLYLRDVLKLLLFQREVDVSQP